MKTFPYSALRAAGNRRPARALLLAAAILLLPATTATAQEEEDPLKIKPEGNELRIEAAGFGITLGKSVFQHYESRTRRYVPRVTTRFGIASMELGFNQFPDIAYAPQCSGNGNFLNLHTGKSIRFGWTPFEAAVRLDRRGTVSFGAGIRFTWDNYRFARNITLATDDKGYLVPVELDGNIAKTKLAQTWLGIPLRLTFRPGGNFRISLTGAPELLLESHTKFKHPKTKSSVSGLEQFRFTVGGAVTLSKFGVYCNYCLTPLFTGSTPADARVLSFGFIVGI